MTKLRLVAAALAVTMTAGCSALIGNPLDRSPHPPSLSTVSGTTTSTTSLSGVDTALELARQIQVKGRAPKTGYSRALFPHWSDLDKNGCNTRDDILMRDSIDRTTLRNGCVSQVVVNDPYSGQAISKRGELDIDHVVALSNAWQTGAQQFDSTTREKFANDPLNLLAVDDNLNQQKGDGDAATWLPPNRSYWCAYVARQTTVKGKYGLWFTQAEKDRIVTILEGCPTEPLAVG